MISHNLANRQFSHLASPDIVSVRCVYLFDVYILTLVVRHCSMISDLVACSANPQPSGRKTTDDSDDRSLAGPAGRDDLRDADSLQKDKRSMQHQHISRLPPGARSPGLIASFIAMGVLWGMPSLFEVCIYGMFFFVLFFSCQKWNKILFRQVKSS